MRKSKKGKQKWYLSVSPRKNQEWTQEKMNEVFTLRKELPAREVAKKLGLTVIQVYNATRLIRRKRKNECYSCGHELTKEDKLVSKGKKIKICNTCREKFKSYKKGRVKIARKHKICVYCQKRKARPGYVSCAKCVSATHRRRYAMNLCGQCGKNPINYPEESLCPSCAEKNRKKAVIYNESK